MHAQALAVTSCRRPLVLRVFAEETNSLTVCPVATRRIEVVQQKRWIGNFTLLCPCKYQ